MRTTWLAVAALALMRIVVGLHFFLEGMSHLRDPQWSSAGFRRAAVGPFAEWYRGALPQTGDWSRSVGRADGRPAAEAIEAWKASVVADWKRLERERLDGPRGGDGAAIAGRLAAATEELDAFVAGIEPDLVDYRLEVARLDAMASAPGSKDIPFARDRVAKKQRELSAKAAGWMQEVEAIGRKLEAGWDADRPAAGGGRAAGERGRSALWKADRFVSWSLVAIGACLVAGLLVKFNAMGGVLFLASVIASQPFWVRGAQPTYDQWVEMAALLVLATLPVGGWSGIDYFLTSWCPWSGCRNRNGGRA
ncbi:MAG: hypothetical protein ACKOCW_12565 [Planctomycetaceae bacterium]